MAITRRATLGVIPLLALATVLAAGCSSGRTTSHAASPASSSGITSSAEPTYDVMVVGKTVTGVPSRLGLKAGETVRLVITADRTSELHIHAGDPEVETHTQQGQSVTVEFHVQKQPGLYEVEMHDPDLLLFQVQVK